MNQERRADVAAFLDTLFTEDRLKNGSVSVSMASACWLGEGALQLQSDIAQESRAMDLPAERADLDKLVGRSVALGELSNKYNFWTLPKIEFNDVAQTLHCSHRMLRCWRRGGAR